MTSDQALLSAPAAAQRLRDAGVPVSEDTVRRWADRGQIQAVKLPSGRYMFRAEDIDALTQLRAS